MSFAAKTERLPKWVTSFLQIQIYKMKTPFPFYLCSIILLCSACQTLHKDTINQLQSGDLLFKDTQNNNIASAIKDVTPSLAQYSFSHVGVAFYEDEKWKVLEAIPASGVHIVPLSSFLSPAKGETIKVVAGRLKRVYPFDIEKLIRYGKAQVGKPYDKAFVWNDEKFYCSELVYQMFVHAGQQQAFSPQPMTFKEKNSNYFHPTWVLYYKKLGIEIPEGALGINPNAMAKSESIDFLFELP